VPQSRANLPQGTLDLLILRILSLEPLHGYAIAQRLAQISHQVVQTPQGSLYPALHRLENRGALGAEWRESEGGRKSKYYRLTAKGRAELRQETAAWLQLTEAVRLILAAGEGEV
jgi:PadR family transcriptional regulator PadR